MEGQLMFVRNPTLLIIFLLYLSWPSSGFADTLTTVHGLKINGAFLNVEGACVRFKCEDGRVMKYPIAEIESLQGESGEIELAQSDKEKEEGEPDQARQDFLLPYRVESSPGDFDEVVLKTGGTLKGLINAVDDKKLEMFIVLGETSVSKTAVQINQIAAIRKLDQENRDKLASRIDWIRRTGPGSKVFEEGGKCQRIRHPLLGECWEVTTEHFLIAGVSTKEFLTSVARRLEQRYQGYHEYFEEPQGMHARIDVVIFPSYRKYLQYFPEDSPSFQTAGFYLPDAGIIVTHHEYETGAAKIEDMQRLVLEINQELDRLERENTAREDENYRQARKTQYEYARLEKEIREETRRELDALFSEIDQIPADQFSARKRQIEDWERDSLDNLNEARDRAKRDEYAASDYNATICARIEEVRAYLKEIDDYTQHLLSEFEKDRLRVLYHEAWHAYVDKVLYPQGEGSGFPIWLNEGMAEFFENGEIDYANTFVGKPDEQHLLLLRLTGKEGFLPLREIFSYGRKEAYAQRAGLFYAESWLIAYLLVERHLSKDKALLQRYVRETEKSGDPIASFDRVFRMKPEDFEREMKAFVFEERK